MSTDLCKFTVSQANHAVVQLEKLWHERRFFLDSDAVSGVYHPWNLDVFKSLTSLEWKHRQAYAKAKEVAEGYLCNAECDLGIVSPDLSGRNLVQCNRYGGGLKICTAWPLAHFAKYVPKNFNELLREVAQKLDNNPPSLTRFSNLAEIIWNEFESLNVQDSDERVVVMFKTSFVPFCHSGDEGDLLDGLATDLQKYPHALGYLLYQSSFVRRLLPYTCDPQVLTSTTSGNHVVFSHLSQEAEPQIINFSASRHQYVRKVYFAAIL